MKKPKKEKLYTVTITTSVRDVNARGARMQGIAMVQHLFETFNDDDSLRAFRVKAQPKKETPR